jgi:hypothetical protein
LNCITGIDSFDQVDYSQGTTESFDHFYIKHPQRRFRCFRGEYLYHQLVWMLISETIIIVTKINKKLFRELFIKREK